MGGKALWILGRGRMGRGGWKGAGGSVKGEEGCIWPCEGNMEIRGWGYALRMYSWCLPGVYLLSMMSGMPSGDTRYRPSHCLVMLPECSPPTVRIHFGFVWYTSNMLMLLS